MVHDKWKARYRELERTLEHIFLSLGEGENPVQSELSKSLSTTQTAMLQVVRVQGHDYLICVANSRVDNYYFGVIEEDRLVRERMSPMNSLAISGNETRIVCRVYFTYSADNEPYTVEWRAEEHVRF